jgi:hypothetical protein
MSTLVPLIEAITFQSSEDPESRTVSLVAGFAFIVPVRGGDAFNSDSSRRRHDELARPGLGLSSRSCLPLVTARSRCFAMGYSPQFAAPRSLRLGDLGSSAPRQIGTNQTTSYSILRYSGEISFRFIAAFRGAENSSEAMRRISIFNLRLLMS